MDIKQKEKLKKIVEYSIVGAIIALSLPTIISMITGLIIIVK